LIICAKIIGDSIKSREMASAAKAIIELEGMIKERNTQPLAPTVVNKPPSENPGEIRVEGVVSGTNPIKGRPEAKVLIIEFSDFQCPYSKMFYKQTFPQIDKEYISSGKVKFAYRDFPLSFHPQAIPAAVAARCAGRQGKYWQMFDKLISEDSLDKEALKKYSQELGLKQRSFEECLNKPEIKEDIGKDISDAHKSGVNGTPAFFINGRFVSGAYRFEGFKKIIEEELSASPKKK
jgi:protein-disulfide isomerase